MIDVAISIFMVLLLPSIFHHCGYLQLLHIIMLHLSALLYHSLFSLLFYISYCHHSIVIIILLYRHHTFTITPLTLCYNWHTLTLSTLTSHVNSIHSSHHNCWCCIIMVLLLLLHIMIYPWHLYYHFTHYLY